MHEEITIPELTEVVARLPPSSASGRAPSYSWRAGSPTTFRVNFGGTDYVVRLPGKKTSALGIDREAERMATKAAPQSSASRRRSPP